MMKTKKLVDNIKLDSRKIKWNGMNRIGLAEDKGQ
jgi:hypothetical protein